MQPIYKDGNKLKTDPASYRGIYLSSALAKLFEGLLLHRLTQYTEAHETLTPNQLGTRPGRQTHDAIYSLLPIIQSNWTLRDSPTYVAFLDYSTAYQSVHRGRLAVMLHQFKIVGKMWHHLCNRFQSVKLRVLHPGIAPHQTVQILRGLPEGSRLSPTLFGLFAADLVNHLKRKFPAATILHKGQHLWVGGFLYVDDLCLLSTSADELQHMLHECQTWSEKARMQINAQKSKVMTFHETPAQKRKRKEQKKQTGSASQPTYPPPFHIVSAFPPHRQCSHPLEEVQEFDYLGLRLDPKLKMTAALHRIQEKVNKSNALVFAVSHSLRYDDSSHRHRPSINANPTQTLNLWKACVLPHLLQNLRYLTENQVDSLEVTLKSSLKRTLHVYGHPVALCANMGVPPLRLTQQVQLAQLRFRLTRVHKDSIPGTLYEITMFTSQYLPPQAMERLMEKAQNHLYPQSALHPPQVNQALPENKEKSYKNWLRVQASNLWRRELMSFKLPAQAPGRLPAYVQYNTKDLERVNLYKPAPYLSIHHGHALDLIRLRAQAWPQYIPTHLHFSGRKARPQYQHRYCEYCHQSSALGDETHIFLKCPTTASLVSETIDQIHKKLRLFDAPPVILYRHPTGQHPAWKPPSLPPQGIYKGVDAGVCPFAPHIHDEASVPPRLPTTPTFLGA